MLDDLPKLTSPVFEDLASYLREIDLESIEPQNLEGFTYLSNILRDTSLYLMEMFVDRILRDVYVFQDSMQSNIEFMENKLSGKAVEMPKMDSLEFLAMIGKQKPIPTIICSTLVTRGSSSVIDAMRMGAVDIVLKPSAQDEKSSILYGMPKQAVDIGAVQQSLGMADIAKVINTAR